MPKASLAPQHYHGPQLVTTRPSWTPVYVDRRLVPPNRHVPDLSRYIMDKVEPKEGDYHTDHSIPFLGLCSTSRAGQSTEGHRELLHRILSSSSSPMRGRLYRRQGNLRISTELTPYQISLHSVVTPQFWVLLSIRIISYWT